MLAGIDRPSPDAYFLFENEGKFDKILSEIEENMNNLFLFASFGFFEGMGRVLDLTGTMVGYNASPTIGEADNWALNSDWKTVGDDLRNALNSYAKNQKTED